MNDESEVARIQRRLQAIEAEQTLLRARLAAMQDSERDGRVRRPEVAAPPSEPRADRSSPLSPTAKIGIFRHRFSGRTDVYPRLWVNARDGRKGYSPVCNNEWVPDVCDKPKIKCGDCRHQAFLPLDDEAIEGHLRGRHVLGVYPLSPDGTCRFLAMDFDEADWQDDVRAVVATCKRLDVPVAVERSRSGAGAHLWFFFSDAVSAASARRMGFRILTDTSASTRDVGLKSFDRLFPNQDHLPKGGFGNLIALPLQREARRFGNTEFVDETLVPWPDQWRFLAEHPTLDVARVTQLTEGDVGRSLQPPRRPAGKGDATKFEQLDTAEPLAPAWPPAVRATFGAALSFKTSDLHSVHAGRLRRLATFSNPEFFKRQHLRLSTARTPRFIAAFSDVGDELRLPRGLLDEVSEMLEAAGSRIEVDDARSTGDQIDVRFLGTLTTMQTTAVASMSSWETGILVAPPGFGKTVVAAALVAARKRRTLVLVHRRVLVEQWIERLRSFLDVAPSQVDVLGKQSSRRRRSRPEEAPPVRVADVATFQSLVRRADIGELLGHYEHVIVDEAHHVPASSFERVLLACRARYVVGLTATPRRRDGMEPILRMQIGRVRHTASHSASEDVDPPRRRLIVRDRSADFVADGHVNGIAQVYSALAADEIRNDLLLDDVIAAFDEGRSILILTERRDHLHGLVEPLRRIDRGLVVLHGGMTTTDRRRELSRLASGACRLVLATGRFVGEGLDVPALDTLFLTLPVAWKGTIVQYVGRIARAARGKTELRVYDYGDPSVPVLERMAKKRRRALRALGFISESAVPAFVEEGPIRSVEFDDDD